jgi:hypothetical protein
LDNNIKEKYSYDMNKSEKKVEKDLKHLRNILHNDDIDDLSSYNDDDKNDLKITVINNDSFNDVEL